MIGDTQRIYQKIDEFKEHFESVKDFINSYYWIDRLLENVSYLHSSEKLLEISKRNLIAVLSNFYSLGPGSFRLYNILKKNTIEEIKDSIFLLLYGEGNIEDRIIMTQRPGIGISFLSQALCFYDPKQFSIKDRISKIGICIVLGYGEIIPGDVLNDDVAAKPYDDMSYTEFHKLVSEVGKHFILKMLQIAGDEKEKLGKFINERKYLLIDQFLRFCYSGWK
ncbi:MAG: hypothetical protein B5M53_08380 [Candidatus Cloacimonas sp. 4484_209]|nr:MAG: hypothetical protein B5M53_08380 [Candidatus Cloacimonas sp. 4484_209]